MSEGTEVMQKKKVNKKNHNAGDFSVILLFD